MMDPYIAQLVSAFQEITRLQKQNLDLLYEAEMLKEELSQKVALAEIEAKHYSGIKKIFKKGWI